MSGHKRVSININAEDYRRMHDAEMKLRNLEQAAHEKKLADLAQAVLLGSQENSKQIDPHEQELITRWKTLAEREQKLEEQLAAERQDLAVRQNAYLETIGDWFSQEAVSLEESVNEALANQENTLRREYEALSQKNWETTRRLLAQQAAWFEEDFGKEQKRQRAQMQRYARQSALAEKERARKEEISQHWLQSAAGQAEFIEKNYLLKGDKGFRFSTLVDEIDQAWDNFFNGLPEAALIGAQHSQRLLSEMRIEIEKEEIESRILRAAVVAEIDRLQRLIELNRNPPAMDLDGSIIAETVDVDYWTNGALMNATTYLSDLAGQVEFEGPSVENDTWALVLDQTLPRVAQDIEESVYQARFAALSSQLRINIADTVVEALSAEGYELNNGGYVQGDMRSEYSVLLRSYEGGAVNVRVTPTMGIESELHLQTTPEQGVTEYEMRLRAQEIAQALKRSGLQVGEVTTVEPLLVKESEPERAFIRKRLPTAQ